MHNDWVFEFRISKFLEECSPYNTHYVYCKYGQDGHCQRSVSVDVECKACRTSLNPELAIQDRVRMHVPSNPQIKGKLWHTMYAHVYIHIKKSKVAQRPCSKADSAY